MEGAGLVTRDAFPEWLPDDLRAKVHAQAEANVAAAERIRRGRRQLTQADAEHVVREEFARRDIHLPEHNVREKARIMLTPAWWRFLWEWERDST